MTTTTADITLRRMHVPTSLTDADAADFLEMVRVRNEIYAEISGHEDESVTPEALLPHYQPDPDSLRYVWVIEAEGEIIGRVGVDIPQEADSVVALWLVEILRAWWGRGIGTTAYRLVEQTARAHGRLTLQSWAQHMPGDEPAIEAPTGFGRVPKDHIAHFYLRHGYTLEQVERSSAFDLRAPATRLTQLLSEATAASTDYRIVQWEAPTPPELIDGYAWMKSRMSTDVPAAALDVDEEVWDAARVARHEARHLDASSTLQVTAAQHVESGILCAFNELMIPVDHTAASHQEDTLVLKEHRGHRLGMLVKCAGLLKWRERMPLSPRVLTYNAEENRPMLDINEALGFEPIAYVGAWKKTLTASDSAGNSDSSGS
ncbi:GNAT family N-acetyltransferase [Microbacterium sp. C7(2022)]|uniref:GNAT family N-acetyltransferase n=1 Tax=Microbacterium sp. C7(2022) TaxID=2992759 RepID=UPI00237C4D48|nr:GNAT family N-acetyltransferase [Microbacterium sp. C7(2022)]MDE0546881.1 GNAT family N-acetyltransferase [Microbacterium sp. C7(2022)]